MSTKRTPYTDSTLAKVKPADVMKQGVFEKVAKTFVSIAAEHGHPILDAGDLVGEIEEIFEKLTKLKARCNLCGDHFWTVRHFVEHYRAKHPREALNCLQSFGTIGNHLAESTIHAISEFENDRGSLSLLSSFAFKIQQAKKKRGTDLASAVRDFLDNNPGNGFGCYLECGTVGDEFADRAVEAVVKEAKQRIEIAIKKEVGIKSEEQGDGPANVAANNPHTPSAEVSPNHKRPQDKPISATNDAMRLRKEIADRMVELAGKHNYNVPPVLRAGIENMIDDAFQIAGTGWRCDCGAITWTEEEMVQHFREEHPRSAHELYGICGTGDKFVDRGFSALFSRIDQLQDLLKKHSIPVPEFQSEIVPEPLPDGYLPMRDPLDHRWLNEVREMLAAQEDPTRAGRLGDGQQ